MSAAGNEPVQELQLVVRRMTLEADGVLSLELADPYGDDLPPWEPGAHLDLWLPSGVRQYSLCGDPADRKRYRTRVVSTAERVNLDWPQSAPDLVDGMSRSIAGMF